jgi:hypothetical protein
MQRDDDRYKTKILLVTGIIYVLGFWIYTKEGRKRVFREHDIIGGGKYGPRSREETICLLRILRLN